MRREEYVPVPSLRAVPQQARMLLTGVAATLVDVTTLMALAVVGWIPIGLAAVTGAFAGGAANFFMIRRWVFAVRGAWLKQFVLYNLCVVAAGALLCGGIVHVAVHAGLAVVAAKGIASIVTLIVWNYPVSAHVVFREEESA